ncbi:DUF2235 domain-containing protein [Pseudothioclava arenosa]|uniref:T6SS Phospholipase effector Tle1-like catalytic domain-containing protein n=1 Tax=Pseudothioclava arenosa TaxID=1795308 RepID=A0A2A4CUX4_9RHOB|nr:DUF2235 domain-containing protein [Pseudothioclava arenosa]PCD77884.1 hypothetical protein CLN94_00765 [Pseudothioclava arenosa]
MRGLIERLSLALRRRLPGWAVPPAPSPRLGREPLDHVILLDGTLGSLKPGQMTSIGLIYRFLRSAHPRASLYYGKGLQWREWRELSELWFGWGVEAQIERAYGWLASRYRPGDRIFIIGYSRGAFAARSLAGMIGRVGLLTAEAAIERNVRSAWRLYQGTAQAQGAEAFHRALCHPDCPIEFVGVFDTVMGLGFQLPVLWMLSEPRYRFHDHHLGAHVRHGCQALALDETRSIFEPLIWESEATAAGRIEQCWFRGTHGDIGGQLVDFEEARPLANIPLVWMLERAQAAGLDLPEGWAAAFPTDPGAPSIGSWRRFGKMFLLRAPRVVGRDASECLHPSVPETYRKRLTRRLRAASPPDGSVEGRAHDEARGRSGRVEATVLHAADLTARDPG